MRRGIHSPRFMVSPGKQRSSGALPEAPGEAVNRAVGLATGPRVVADMSRLGHRQNSAWCFLYAFPAAR